MVDRAEKLALDSIRSAVGKLRPAGRMGPARVHYAARRHVHVRKFFLTFYSEYLNHNQ